MKVVGIIQARLGSTRLPGKVLAPIHGKPMLQWMLQRIAPSLRLDDLVIATTNQSEDDLLVNWVKTNTQIEVFRGAENNLVSRYYECARVHQADIIVRLTADDPLKDAEIIDEAIELFLNTEGIDYCSNCLKPTYPEGLDVEVFSMNALHRTFQEAQLASELEHLTPYMTNNPDKFSIINFECHEDLSGWRWTVDKPNDLKFIKEIFAQFKDTPTVSYREIIDFINANPSLMDINQGTERFEGYLKSVEAESEGC